jgi:hypothetical protein
LFIISYRIIVMMHHLKTFTKSLFKLERQGWFSLNGRFGMKFINIEYK